MERLYTYKYRLYPDKEQIIYLSKLFDCCRLVYNYFLNEKQTQYQETKSSDSYNVQQSKLTKLRKNEDYEFLNEMPLQVLQASLRNMHTAFDRFYKHKGGYPNYKSKRDKQAFIKVEDLNIKGMVKNHKLAETINECNWGEFVNMLQYKCDWNNKQLVKVDRFYPSSQLCSECGCKNKKVKNLAIRQWTCECCGSKHDRDVNAAINILKYNSSRNDEHSRGGVSKPNGTTCSTSDCLDSAKAIGKETIIELEVL